MTRGSAVSGRYGRFQGTVDGRNERLQGTVDGQHERFQKVLRTDDTDGSRVQWMDNTNGFGIRKDPPGWMDDRTQGVSPCSQGFCGKTYRNEGLRMRRPQNHVASRWSSVESPSACRKGSDSSLRLYCSTASARSQGGVIQKIKFRAFQQSDMCILHRSVQEFVGRTILWTIIRRRLPGSFTSPERISSSVILAIRISRAEVE